ncbi:MAG: SEL1-like repeat protein [Verrucomicrobia bacterium]|nr:SEL1-like repeat protein [Verrucomicrobiota bacterium]
MASTTCLKCGNKVNNGAVVCPDCGTPVSRRKPTKVAKLFAIVLFFALVGFTLATFIQSREPSLSVASSTPIVPVADFQETKAKADGGDAVAQTLLGEMYSKGAGASQDYKEAGKWYRLAANQGHAIAQKRLGELYEAGQGVPRDEAEAAKWYQRSAEQGFADAQYSLAVLYVTGRGVTRNDVEAVRWYRMAAERGDKFAQYNLGQRYLNGKSVPQDHVEAFKWLSLAAAQGLPDAMSVRDELKGSMTGEQLNEAKRRVAAFVPTKSIKATN